MNANAFVQAGSLRSNTHMTMNDGKNASLAAISSLFSFAAAIEMQTMITILSAIVLPIIFFTIGKAVDVWVQIYFKRKQGADDRKDDA